MNLVAVGVVAFDPDPELILPLVRSTLEEAACVFVFVNAIIEPEILAALEALGSRCRVIHSDDNLGVAEALNLIALHAIVAGCSRVLLFDQDSRPPAALLSSLNQAMDHLQAAGEQVAVVGPAIVAPKNCAKQFKSPRYFGARERVATAGLLPVRYIITSGSLLNLEAFRKIGKFRSDFFIDSVDTEWCLRAWSRGFSCWYVPSVAMEHTIGEGMLLGRYPRQSAMRMYSWFRNQVVTITLPHVPVSWKARWAAHLMLLTAAVIIDAKFDRAVLLWIGRAYADGWRHRLGPPPGAVRARDLPRG